MPEHHLRVLLDAALEKHLIRSGELSHGSVEIHLHHDHIQLEESAAVRFLQTLLDLDETSRSGMPVPDPTTPPSS